MVLEQNLGEPRKPIFEAVASGVSEKDHVEWGAIILVKRRHRITGSTAHIDKNPPEPIEPMTVEDRVAQSTEALQAAKSELRALRADFRATLLDGDKLARIVEQQTKEIERLKRKFVHRRREPVLV